MELAEIDNLVLQVVSELASSDISPEVQLVVVLPPDSGPDPGIRALASAVPDIQFLALGIPGLEPGSNLSVIGARGENFDQQGFLAPLRLGRAEDRRRRQSAAGRHSRHRFQEVAALHTSLRFF